MRNIGATKIWKRLSTSAGLRPSDPFGEHEHGQKQDDQRQRDADIHREPQQEHREGKEHREGDLDRAERPAPHRHRDQEREDDHRHAEEMREPVAPVAMVGRVHRHLALEEAVGVCGHEASSRLAGG
ncbi:MAG: hypothetical protein P8Z76_10145 [Alphaproteobacteria bacterium]